MFGKSVWIAAATLAVLAVVFTAGLALAQTEPVTVRPVRIAPAEAPPVDVKVVEQGTSEIKFFARWACVFSGLAMVGVIWLGWSLRTLARNQVELARYIRDLAAARDQ